MNIWAEQFDMKNTNKNKLEKIIKKNWTSLQITYDKEYNTVYIHDKSMVDDKEFLKLQYDYEFNIANGIFAE